MPGLGGSSMARKIRVTAGLEGERGDQAAGSGFQS